MKHTKNILGTMLLTAVAAASTSCVDDTKLLFNVEKPASIAGMEYLNDYDVLKSYIKSSANPDFKLGIALAVNDYLKSGIVTRLANTNFHEMTAGNAMKYASCVGNDGTMNFDAVQNFVSAAKADGLTIYGHTLAWHAQQNNKYLNGLIAPIPLPVDPNASNKFLHITVPEAGKNPWDREIYYDLAEPLVVGKEYVISMKAKATSTVSYNFWPGIIDGDTQYLPSFSADNKWEETSITFTANIPINRLRFCFGTFQGELCFDDVTLSSADDENLIEGGTFDTEDLSRWTRPGWMTSYSYEIGKEGNDNAGFCLTMTNTEKKNNNWDSQVWYQFASPLTEGKAYTFRAKVKATDTYNCTIFTQSSSGGAQGYPGGLNIGAEWADVSLTFTPGHGQVDKFTFNFGDFVGTIYVDDVVFSDGTSDIYTSSFENQSIEGWTSWSGYQGLSAEGEGYSSNQTSIELTPEEKKDTLTWAMNNWVEGMMKATGGYVTAWDVVNEAISGGGNDEGFYTLQSASNVSPEDAKNNFYWQDYLGNVDYVRIVVAAARKHYVENGGTAPLKLFVNDYNLESDWDDNKKVKSLVHWIEKWEADGVTKIDGIGTQMHVSCYANAVTQKSKEDHVVKMFEILAESGKLVKISELDMGYIDENNTSVKTENMTEAQHKAMAEYYKFIVKKYFEIIPAAQQYGITQWCATDAPSDSGWRGGEPVGLWDSNYSRKHTYAGFADGLAGK
ncbi:endo-1,4-beta-xylanase [Bacteroides cellulosilyticus]|uniref:endo-1,4-beta-xylanase n=1 Tax=Bacteroides cellulosilyticus TaxID=246787 RepID=UPI001C379B59|nr:endo-1,4-beta-xylanase [Bacteroides cellulosilyticus]MBV3639720.1 endo-1,4-beta-xylanase [Bacteroides cellulosilyticus]MBV3664848.1 endo-1,4-beta-xylanase [Bacteroides cellulosilyticus]MBV3687411.1 endo-1,4-beta-xylanase [Bacteroides cellulosilyticus]MBV3696565.1 endo-1,4-beta-xylanase [Bacteroides cellulosilyticus]MBV3710131.1 endo-1,4-beta-xylanase [Bacteroides cellulosilyticus]